MKQLFKMLGLLCLVAARPAAADDIVHFIGRYQFSWDGIALASAELGIDEDRHHYSLHLALTSEGIVKIFTRHRSDTEVRGRRDGENYYPEVYESHYWTKDKPRHIKLVFNAKGVVTEETVEPPENRAERPEVPHSQKDGTLDPLSFLRALPAGNLNPRVFDAKHLWQGKATIMPIDKPVHIGSYEVKGYIISRAPLAGMTAKELRDYNKGEPPLYLLVTDNDKHIPVYMYMTLYLGHVRGLLTKECKTWDECKVI